MSERKGDPTRCVAVVGEPPHYFHWHQCNRKRGHGPGGTYCKQHGKLEEEKQRRLREHEEWIEATYGPRTPPESAVEGS